MQVPDNGHWVEGEDDVSKDGGGALEVSELCGEMGAVAVPWLRPVPEPLGGRALGEGDGHLRNTDNADENSQAPKESLALLLSGRSDLEKESDDAEFGDGGGYQTDYDTDPRVLERCEQLWVREILDVVANTV